MKNKTIWFKLGILLFIFNFPIGYGGLILFGSLAAKTGKLFWLYMASCSYICSWVMLGIGFLLAGPEGMRLVRNKWNKFFRKNNYLNK